MASLVLTSLLPHLSLLFFPSSLASLPLPPSLTTLPHLPPLSPSQGGLVFICGTLDGLIQITSRRHNTEDLIATVMAVEPHSFIYKGRWVCITPSHITVTSIKRFTLKLTHHLASLPFFPLTLPPSLPPSQDCSVLHHSST